MTRLEQLAELAARVVPLRVHAMQDDLDATEVARVVSDADAEVLAAAYNSLPALVAMAEVLARIDARAQGGKNNVLVGDRRAMRAAFEAFDA